ncbi:MAG TPA: metallophosphoesterase, partial [Thermodesulfobacteriota bacterium]|nr:metallophosphoesterase [Thermodesulfobacteriota bacterium]
MSLFLISFFILYGSLHYYIFSRVREAFSPGLLTLGLLAFFLLLMVSAPIVVYTAASRDWDLLARIYGHIGFVWMGIAFLFFAGAMAVNLYRLIAAAAGWFVPGVLPSPGLFWRFVLPLAFALIAAVYGYFDALNIRTERITVKSPKIPAARSPVRIAQISDVHLGVIVRGDRLKRILGAVRQAAPDLFVSTGDLLDAQVERLDELTGFLSEIRPRLGKYAITGNHEYYAGLGKSLEFTRRAGFTLLRGESLVLDGWLNLAGVDDAAGAYQGLVAGKPEGELLS